MLRFLQGLVLLVEHGVSHRQRCRNEGVIWLLLAERLKRVARLLSGSFCLRGVSSNALDQCQPALLDALVNRGSKGESSFSGLHKSSSLSLISFKSQLSEFDPNGWIGICFRGYMDQQLSRFLQVTFGLVDAGF